MLPRKLETSTFAVLGAPEDAAANSRYGGRLDADTADTGHVLVPKVLEGLLYLS